MFVSRLPFLEGELSGVCSLLSSMRDLGSEPVRGDCSASRPKHDPPCRMAVDGRVLQRRRGRRTRCKCGERRGEVWRQLWVKQDAVKHG